MHAIDAVQNHTPPPFAAIGFAEANKTHFDTIAHEYDDQPHALERARRYVQSFKKFMKISMHKRTAARMREFYDFNEDITTVLEYACGTGLVSRQLAPYAKRIVGVDISQGMVDQFNLRVGNQGIAPEEMQAVCVELKGEDGELGDEKFDVIVVSRTQTTQVPEMKRLFKCASAYHHFPDIDNVTRILAHFLKPGGVLLVVDLTKHTGDGHVHHPSIPEKFHHLVPHRGGLEESDMRKAFEGAGLESFSFEDGLTARNDAKLFLAKGSKC
ncbi:hypothetical protein H0H87_005814, partial [Tephrocybe sp. NHM501043]